MFKKNVPKTRIFDKILATKIIFKNSKFWWAKKKSKKMFQKLEFLTKFCFKKNVPKTRIFDPKKMFKKKCSKNSNFLPKKSQKSKTRIFDKILF